MAMTLRTQITGKLAMSLIVSALCTVPANAQQAKQYFSDGADAPKKASASVQLPKEKPVQGALAMMSPRTPIVDWFEKMDDLEYTLSATEGDTALLKRPLNSQAERVQEWAQTASKVAKNYRLLATTLDSMEIPKTAPLLKQYRDLKADWYKDTAGILDDMIRPRKPAKTMEQLDAQVHDIKQRAGSLNAERRQLSSMDLQLRKQYNVHLAWQTDALQQYVKGKVPTR